MISLDEAIKRTWEIANVDFEEARGLDKRDFQQISNWLEELKVYKDSERLCKRGFEGGYTKAIDDFAEALKSDEFQKYNIDMVFETSRDLTYTQCTDAFCEYVDIIAEQLKEGSADNE